MSSFIGWVAEWNSHEQAIKQHLPFSEMVLKQENARQATLQMLHYNILCLNMFTWEIFPHVHQLTAKGEAEKDGRLKIGQRILEINGTSLLGATHLVAVRALRSNPMEVSLLVCDGYDPREVVRRKKEQERLSTASHLSATLDSSSLSSEGEHSMV